MTHCENGAFPCPDHDNCIPDLFMDYLTIRVFPDNHYIISIYMFPHVYIYIYYCYNNNNDNDDDNNDNDNKYYYDNSNNI